VPDQNDSLRADARANRDAILEAAARLYAEHDSTVPSADIAKAAGVGRATLSRRFPTTQSLQLAVLEQLVERMEELAADLPETPYALGVFIDQALRLLDENAPLVQLMRSRTVPATDTEDAMKRLQGLTAGPLRRAQEAGLVDPDVQPEDIRLILIMTSSVAQTHLDPQVRERATMLAWRAIAPRPAQGPGNS
jgi:AcrR family transcriptional regulator